MDDADVTREAEIPTSESQPDHTDSVKSAKKKFITPEISAPVDVLEATTYFQATTTGGGI